MMRIKRMATEKEEEPFFIQKDKFILPSGKTQVYGLFYYPTKDILIHY